MNLLCGPVKERYTHNVPTSTHYLISHPSEQQRVLFCDPLEFSLPPLPLRTAFDLNRRGRDVANAETYHAARPNCVYVCVILNIPVINKAL